MMILLQRYVRQGNQYFIVNSINIKQRISYYNFIMRAQVKTLFIICLFIVSLQQQCSLSSSNDLLQAGSTVIYNGRSASRQHLFTLNANFNGLNSPLQVAASVSTLQVSPTNGLDFSVRGSPGQGYGTVLIVLLINEDNTWTTIKVSYLLSGRTDFTLGFYVADIYLASRNSNTITVKFNIPDWTPTQKTFTSIAEFSGVKTSANSFSIGFGSISLNGVSGVFSVSITTVSSIAIENIFITYIIFDVASPIKYIAYDPSNTAPGSYPFVGLQRISSSNSAFAGSAFTSAASVGLTCVGGGCPSSCVSSQLCLNIGGQIAGNTCYKCLAGQIFVNGNCQSSINQCPRNEYWDGSKCLCVSGFIRVNGANGVNGVCYASCGQNAYILNNACLCIPGYTYSQSVNQCVQTTGSCGTNLILVNGVCVCPSGSGLGLINGRCVLCPSNSFVNSIGNCQCTTGFTLNSVTLSCVTSCFPNSTPNSLGQCVCNDGFYNQGNQCIPYVNCPNGMVHNGQTCACPNGQYINSFTNNCGPCNNNGQTIQGNTCVCLSSYYPTALGCFPCTANSIYSSLVKQCVCLSGYSLVNNQCVSTCPSGAQWNALTSSCQCSTFGFYIINNSCAPCPANSVWTGSSCQCQNNMIMSGNTCIVSCRAGSTWNGQACVCNNGFYLIGGNCVTCDPNSSYNSAQLTCFCNRGFYGNWQKCYNCDSSCATCSGPSSTQCSSCANGNLNANGGCTTGCPSGQFINPNNVCSACMANCALCYSATTCATCASGYNQSLAIVNGNVVMSCNLIPRGTSSTISLRSFVSGNGVVYQGVAMSLMPTSILADGCVICNDLLLVNAASSFAVPTTSVQFITNSQYWFLITFSFSDAAFIPNFQFTVQINPIYANQFSAVDMTQKLISVFTPEILMPTKTLTTRTATSGSRASVSPSGSSSGSGSGSSSSPQVSKGATNAQLAKIFG